MDYIAINPHQSFEIKDSFCDGDGNTNPALPVSKGTIAFVRAGTGTVVEFKVVYSTKKEVQTIIEMGFEQAITTCLEQLETLFQEDKI